MFEETVERLAQAIRLGVVETGERLPPERELAAHLNVSRMTLREAIKALHQAGYVETRRGRTGGTVVVYDRSRRRPSSPRRLARALGREAIEDALAFRSVVEPGAAALAAARRLADVDQQRLRDALAAATNPQPSARRVSDSRLHVLVGELSGSPTLAAGVADAQARLDDLLASIPVFDHNIRHSDAQHGRVVRAILRGRPDEARAAMAEHVDGTALLLRGLLT
jgi:GntR family transcriptional regulator, transcriptional repressor for pyruvate dehydrogenase complex